MTEIIRIPEERVKVLIGKEGRTKKTIEQRCGVGLQISDEEVQISGDPADTYFAMEVVKAIGRGFEPRKALLLLKDDYTFYLIPLRELLPTDKAIKRLKGRVIGEEGRIKTLIEEATDSFVSVYGNTIAIIAKADSIEYAKEAISMLINGAKHSTVLSYLAKSKREIMDSRFRG